MKVKDPFLEKLLGEGLADVDLARRHQHDRSGIKETPGDHLRVDTAGTAGDQYDLARDICKSELMGEIVGQRSKAKKCRLFAQPRGGR